MSDHLDLEHCKNLAGWGLPQELGQWGWHWKKSKQYKDTWHTCALAFTWDVPEEYFKIPSLETLMEFAKTLDEPVLYWNEDQWVARWRFKNDCDLGGHDPNPTLAVYKLIEKLQEVKA